MRGQKDFAFDILALPNEVLDRVFCYFNDESLLNLSHVCTRFTSIAFRAFAKKYLNKNYEISGIRKTYRGFHCAILNKFGSVLTGIFIYKYDLIYDDICLMNLMVENCMRLKKLQLIDVSINLERLFLHLNNLTYCSFNGISVDENDVRWSSFYLPHLKHLDIRFKGDLKYANFAEFLGKNGQIEVLFIDTKINVLNLIDSRLKKLRSLKIVHYPTIGQTVEPLSSLESLEISSINPSGLLGVFEMCCKNLSHLKLISQHQKHLDDSTLETICSLKSLKSLNILYASISIDQIVRIKEHLPHLTFLHVEMNANDELIEHVLLILSSFRFLENLEIQFDAITCPKKINYNFHIRYLATIGKSRDVELHL